VEAARADDDSVDRNHRATAAGVVLGASRNMGHFLLYLVAQPVMAASGVGSGRDPVTVASLERLVESPTRAYGARCEGAAVGITLLVPHRRRPVPGRDGRRVTGASLQLEDVVGQPFRGDREHAAMADLPEAVISFDLRSHAVRQAGHEHYLRLGFRANDTTAFRRTVSRPNSA